MIKFSRTLANFLVAAVSIGAGLAAPLAAKGATEVPPFNFACKSVGNYVVDVQGADGEQAPWDDGFSIFYRGGPKAYLTLHLPVTLRDQAILFAPLELEIIHYNGRLVTAIHWRPVDDGVAVFALDIEAGLINNTLTTSYPGGKALDGGADTVVTRVKTYACTIMAGMLGP